MSAGYNLGFDDGYAEGYGAKLKDATEPFNPAAAELPERIEEAADHIQRKYAKVFDGDRAGAIGLARSIARILTPSDTAGGGK